MDGVRYRRGWTVARHVAAAFLLLLTLGTMAAPVTADDNTPRNITPRYGTAVGGTTVLIISDHLTGATNVSFGDIAARFTVNDAGTQITTTSPAHDPGSVPVTVKLANGTIVTEGTFGFFGIISVSPDSGTTAGGTPFAINAVGAGSDATVSLGGTLATNVHLTAPGILNGLTPAHAAGAVDITITNTNGPTLTKSSAYTYIVPTPSGPPTIVSLDPSQGPATESTATSATNSDSTSDHHPPFVAITGTNFQPGATVSFDTSASSVVYVVSSTQIYATSPPHVAGTVPVTVTNPDGQFATLANAFTYVPVQTVPLSITDIDPSSGPTGATEARLVKIAGTSFQQGASVTFGAVAGTNVTVVDSEHLTVNAPNQGPGTVDVTVTNPDNTRATKSAAYTYFTPVRIQSINPTSGPAAGGTSVTITGTNFHQGATVAFDDQQATNIVVNGDGTQITATTPTHRASVATISVTNPDHSRGYLPFGYSFTGDTNPPPTTTLSVREVYPKAGPMNGGVHVIILGTGFTTNTTVAFDGVAATQVTMLDNRTIIVVTPAHAAGAVTVTVTDGGTTATWGDTYLYVVSTNTRQTWETPGMPDDTPKNAPSGRPASSGTGPAGTTSTTGSSSGSALNSVPTHR